MSHKEAHKAQTILCLIGILLLAVALRAYGVLSHPTVPNGDAADYQRLATGLVEGRGYVNVAGAPTAWRPPAYPIFLAGVYEILGVSVLRATIVQAILGGLTVLMLTALGAMVLGWRRALIAGVIAAVYPAFVWLPRLLLSENLSLFLLLLSLGAIIFYLRTTRMVWMIVFAILCALNTLVRGANLFLPIVVALGLLVICLQNRGAATEGRPYKDSALQEFPSRFCRGGTPWPPQLMAALTVMAVAFIVTLLPWTIRNYRIFHHPIPIATQDGLTLYGSYWPPQKNGKLIWGTLPGNEDPAVVTAAQTGDEVSESRYLNQLTRQRLRDNPGFFFD
jgi:Dolichyl-phosphate-mannose-protein mannosyltransferase